MNRSLPMVRTSRWQTFSPFLILVLCAVWILAARIYTYSEPIERDLATYAACAHELLAGGKIYRDFWELKPPGSIWTYALAERIAGYGEPQLLFLGVSAAWLTLAGLYVAGKRLGNPWTGVLAAVFWTLTCSDLYLQANQPNVEVMINACMAWYVALLLGAAIGDTSNRRLLARGVGLGLIVGLATLYKQFMLVPCLLMAAALLVAPPAGRLSRTQVWKLWWPAAITVCLFWVAVLAYLKSVGSLEGFIIVLTKWSTSYAGNPLANLVSGLAPKNLAAFANRFLWPLALLSVAGLVLARRTPAQHSNAAVLAAFLCGTYLSIAMPGKFFPHYYQLWLPVVCLGGAWGFFQVLRATEGRKPLFRHVEIVAAAGIAGLLVLRLVPFYTMTAEEWSAEKYSYEFVDAKMVGQDIGARIGPETRTFQWGMEPNIYFYSRRRAACMLDVALLLPHSPVLPGGNPLYGQFQRQFRQAMEKYKPPVIEVNLIFDREGPAYEYLYEHYRPFPHDALRTNYLLAVRKGSALEKQLIQANRSSKQRHPAKSEGPQVPPYLPPPGKRFVEGIYDPSRKLPKQANYLW